MQFHLNGVRPGDPGVAAPAGTAPGPGAPVDVLIVGAGPVARPCRADPVHGRRAAPGL